MSYFDDTSWRRNTLHAVRPTPAFYLSPTFAGITKFPAELIDAIFAQETYVDHFYQYALVCRAWAPIAQRHLYHSIDILSAECLGRFRSVIESFPHLAAFVRRMSFTLFTYSAYDGLDSEGFSFHKRIVPLLKQVRSVSIRVRGEPLDDQFILFQVLDGIADHAPKLRSVDLAGFNGIFFEETFRRFASKNVSHEPEFEIGDPVQGLDSIQDIAIEGLHELSESFLPWVQRMCRSGELQNLTRLSCTGYLLEESIVLPLNKIIALLPLEHLALSWKMFSPQVPHRRYRGALPVVPSLGSASHIHLVVDTVCDPLLRIMVDVLPLWLRMLRHHSNTDLNVMRISFPLVNSRFPPGVLAMFNGLDSDQQNS
ncbi:hypothetical protein BDZ89DRAFT_1145611 [Hymenopellis radicata]|nr:hypothetical protein BDZ89DRAFT_1145611 [Hymenopellis radicata]